MVERVFAQIKNNLRAGAQRASPSDESSRVDPAGLSTRRIPAQADGSAAPPTGAAPCFMNDLG
jgi:hypothetical protein